MTLTTREFLAYCHTPETKWTMDTSGNWIRKPFIRFKEANGNLADREVSQIGAENG